MERDSVIGYIQFNKAGWEIIERQIALRVSHWVKPLCRSCSMDLALNNQDELKCENPTCKRIGKSIQLTQNYQETKQLVIKMWHASVRKKTNIKWLNFDQEMIPLAEAEDKDTTHWVKAKLFDSKEGKTLMILVGKTGERDKVHLFVKDGLNLTVFDNSDLQPNELFAAFRAHFSDGTVSITDYKPLKKPN